MAWTWPTAVFFGAIALALCCMTVLEIVHPTRARRGFLPLVTTRGDRFFISLLTAAVVHAAWLGWSDGPVAWASAISLVSGAVLMRWG